MPEVRDDRKYTKDDDWLKEEEGGYKMGITDYAQENLGEIVGVELSVAEGDAFEEGDPIAIIESFKDTVDILAPFKGKVIKANGTFLDTIDYEGKFNEAPYEEWLFVLEPEGELEGLLSAEEYAEHRSK